MMTVRKDEWSASTSQMILLHSVTHIPYSFMDGTFSTAPKLFARIFLIHGFLAEKQFPQMSTTVLVGKQGMA